MRRRQELPEDWVFRLDGFLSYFFVFVFCFFVADADVIVVFSVQRQGFQYAQGGGEMFRVVEEEGLGAKGVAVVGGEPEDCEFFCFFPVEVEVVEEGEQPISRSRLPFTLRFLFSLLPYSLPRPSGRPCSSPRELPAASQRRPRAWPLCCCWGSSSSFLLARGSINGSRGSDAYYFLSLFLYVSVSLSRLWETSSDEPFPSPSSIEKRKKEGKEKEQREKKRV